MSNNDKNGLVEEQRRRQAELLELKKKKQEFENNIDEFQPQGPQEKTELKGAAKFKNFMHYAKGAIVFTLIVCVILGIGIVQCAGRTQYDCTVVLYMKQRLSTEIIENVATVLEQYCPDTNGDGEVNVLVMDCAIPDDARMSEWGQSKATRLSSEFANEESIIYIVDKAAFDELSALDDGNFISSSLKLPLFDGKAFQLNGTIFDSAFDVVEESANEKNEYNYSENFEYYIVRRSVSGTLIEKKKNVKKYSEQADKIIKSIVADPMLEGGKEPELLKTVIKK